MKLLLFNIVLLLKVIFSKAADGDPRIVGGLPAAIGQFPCQASIRMKSSDFPFCGGCVIDDVHVLTAAHCVFETPDEEDYYIISAPRLIVKAGGINDPQLKPFDVQYIFTHPNYRPTKIDGEGDIAMIRIAGNFSEDSGIKPIKISTEQIPEKTNCTVSGWGTTSSGGATSPNLLYTVIKVENYETCAANYEGLKISRKMICAGDSKESHDSCQGDSGGPLICNGRLSGVVSFGKGCGILQFPGIYTNVSSYTDWIEKSTRRSSSSNVFDHFYASVVLFAFTTYGLF